MIGSGRGGVEGSVVIIGEHVPSIKLTFVFILSRHFYPESFKLSQREFPGPRSVHKYSFLQHVGDLLVRQAPMKRPRPGLGLVTFSAIGSVSALLNRTTEINRGSCDAIAHHVAEKLFQCFPGPGP